MLFNGLLCLVLMATAGRAIEPLRRVDENAQLQNAFSFASNDVESRVDATIGYLASDQLEGRGVGKDGLALAASFIANAFHQAGLRTDLWDGLPYQNFRVNNVPNVVDNATNTLEFRYSNGQIETLKLERQFQSMAVGGNGTFDAPMAFVGYGISAHEGDLDYDDFNGIDARGKVLLMLRKEPRQADATSPFNGQQTSPHAYFATKLSNARQRGAAGVLFINDFVSANGDDGLNGSAKDVLPSTNSAGQSTSNPLIPTMFITRDQANRIISYSNSNVQLEDLEAKIDATLSPQSLDIASVRAIGRTNLIRKNVMTSNVVGILEGNGDLADEAVIIGAHYDHVGMGEFGSLSPGIIAVHNGADDNASGTAALIEIARRFCSQDRGTVESRRKIVFVAFSGEERGLLGSKYFVQHPVCDLKTTAAMINLDMVGRMGANQIIVYGVGSSPAFPQLVSNTAQTSGLIPNLQQPAMGPSDHQPFFENGVPVMHFFTGIHAQYHRPDDDFEKINTTGIVRISDMVYQIADQIATQPMRPAFVRVGGRANIQIPTEERGRLGVRLRSDLVEAIFEAISPDSAADRAGLKVDDQVIAIDGQMTESRISMLKQVRECLPGQVIELQILRNNRNLKISVELEHY